MNLAELGIRSGWLRNPRRTPLYFLYRLPSFQNWAHHAQHSAPFSPILRLYSERKRLNGLCNVLIVQLCKFTCAEDLFYRNFRKIMRLEAILKSTRQGNFFRIYLL